MKDIALQEEKPQIAVLGLFGQSVFMNVDHFHTPGETIHALGLYSEPGGKGYNQAVAAQRLGAQVNFYGCGGMDDSCETCISFLNREGITHYIQRTEASASSYACILTDKRGENRVTVYRGAADNFAPDYLWEHEQELAKMDVILINYEYPQTVNEAALDIALRHDVKVILNPAPARAMDSEWAKRCWLVTPNEPEAAALLGISQNVDIKILAQAFIDQGFNRAVVTLGGQGALLIEDGHAHHYPGLKASPVDTTGAGDTFNAALAVAVGQGAQLSDAIEFAMNAAALSIEHKYVMPGLPTLTEMKQRYRRIESKPVV